MTDVCGRIMIGEGGDTWDPTCELPDGHSPMICKSRSAQSQNKLTEKQYQEAWSKVGVRDVQLCRHQVDILHCAICREETVENATFEPSHTKMAVPSNLSPEALFPDRPHLYDTSLTPDENKQLADYVKRFADSVHDGECLLDTAEGGQYVVAFKEELKKARRPASEMMKDVKAVSSMRAVEAANPRAFAAQKGKKIGEIADMLFNAEPGTFYMIRRVNSPELFQINGPYFETQPDV